MEPIHSTSKFKRNLHEYTAWESNAVVCGVDEVGRSCLAGPVVAAAVILKPGVNHKLLKDSKLLTPQERQKAYNWLIKRCDYAVSIISHREIDKCNIYYATLKAMKRAITQVLAKSHQRPDKILIDAMPVRGIDIPVHYFCHGERQSKSIAAASIIAKVTRDNLMDRIHGLYPEYKFNTNKGYGTKEHRNAILQTGQTILHRKRYLGFIENK